MIFDTYFIQAVHDYFCDTVAHIHGFGAVLRDHAQIHRASIRKFTITIAVYILITGLVQHLGCFIGIKFQRAKTFIIALAGRRNHSFSRNLSILTIDGGCQLVVIDCEGSSLTECLVISRSAVFSVLHLVAAGESTFAKIDIRCAFYRIDNICINGICIIVHSIDITIHHSHHQRCLIRIALYRYFIYCDLS